MDNESEYYLVLQQRTRNPLPSNALSNASIYDQLYNLQVVPCMSSKATFIETSDSPRARPSTPTLTRDVPSSLDEPLAAVGVDCPTPRATTLLPNVVVRNTPILNKSNKLPSSPQTSPLTKGTDLPDSPSARPSTPTLTRDVPGSLDEPLAAVGVDCPSSRAIPQPPIAVVCNPLHRSSQMPSKATNFELSDSPRARPSTPTLTRDVPGSLDEPLAAVGVECPPPRTPINGTSHASPRWKSKRSRKFS
ncbi:mucin-7-like [Aedes albopictus]|uniref:Uncharacterized protein n=1 Tax=Aedes albopictus TaxID=7160 RepID=A0ABM1YEZ9_AEDAL